MTSSKYVLLPEQDKGFIHPDLVIAKQRSHCGKSWLETPKAIQRLGFMPPIQIFQEYIRLLLSKKPMYGGDGTRISQQERSFLESDLFNPNDWRAEHLDAYFIDIIDSRYVRYHRFNDSAKLEEVIEPLDQDTLMKTKIIGISLNGWLKNPTFQGLPTKNTKKGNLEYIGPGDDSVAGSLRGLIGLASIAVGILRARMLRLGYA